MPYIKEEKRFELEPSDIFPETAGELNFSITKLCQWYLDQSGKKYDDYNEIIGVLECVKQEFYRRAVVPYEDKKIKENGDVYE